MGLDPNAVWDSTQTQHTSNTPHDMPHAIDAYVWCGVDARVQPHVHAACSGRAMVGAARQCRQVRWVKGGGATCAATAAHRQQQRRARATYAGYGVPHGGGPTPA
eukprot:365126-Chlamydomonas_euryale.AAC.3